MPSREPGPIHVLTTDVVRRTISNIRPDAVIDKLDTLQTRLAGTIRDRTFAAFGLTIFSLVTLGVTLTGIAATVGFVSQLRTREMAVRVALGAQPHELYRLVTREVATAAAVGALVGMVAGRMLSRFVATLVYGLEASDWATIASAAGFVATTMMVTAIITAVRNVRTHSIAALRAE